MNQKNKRKSSHFFMWMGVFVCCFFLGIPLVSAQEFPGGLTKEEFQSAVQDATPDEIVPQEFQYVTEVNNESATLLDSGEVKIDFTLINRRSPFFGVNLSFSVFDAESKTEIFTKPLEKSLSMATNETKTFSHTVKVDFFKNDREKNTYEIYLTGSLSSGSPLLSAPLGTLDVSSESASIPVLLKNCVFADMTKKDSEGVHPSYPPTAGVDVDPNEDLTFVCEYVGYRESIVSAQLAFYERTMESGKITKEVFLEPKNIQIKTFGENEKFVLLNGVTNNIDTPQAYDVKITLLNEKKEKVSNDIIAHFVVRGISATIQDMTLDAFSYKKGDKAKLHLTVTGPASNFPQARGERIILPPVDVNITMKDQRGNICSQATDTLDIEKQIEKDLFLSLEQKCEYPIVSVQVLHEGKVLSERVMDTKGMAGEEESAETSFTKILVIAIMALIIFFLIFLFVSFQKKTRIFKKSSTLVLFLVVTSFSWICVTESASAGTLSASGTYNGGGDQDNVFSIVYSIDYSGSSIAKGSTLTLRTGVYYLGCKNETHQVWTQYQGSWQGSYQSIGETWVDGVTLGTNSLGIFTYTATWEYLSTTTTAPTSSGSHTMYFSFYAWPGTTQYYSLGFSIPTQPAFGYFDGANSSNCSVNGWAFDPDNPSSAIDVHIYRDGPYGSGTAVTSCSTNVTRTDINSAYGISGTHGFNCTLPASYKGTGAHNLYIHAIDTNGDANNVIGGSPKSLTCAAACTVSSWSPDPSTVCSGTSFTQTSNCGTTRAATGTKNCCTASSWSPDPSTVCSGTNFTQTSNCGTTRTATGTKACTSGSCGTAAKTYASTATAYSGTFCSVGTASPASPAFPTAGSSSSWQCLGNGGSTATCYASRSAYACTGTYPANTSVYSGDTTGLSANTAYTYSATNTTTKCQYACNNGYTWNGSSCVAYSCTGTLPPYTSVYSGDTTGLTANTSYLYHATGTTRKCEYKCNSGYIWTGSSCCNATSWTPDPSTICSGQNFTQTSNCGTTRTATGTKTCTNGSCGTAAKTYASTATGYSGTFCSVGTASPASPTFPAAGAIVFWQCQGNGGTTATCSASRSAYACTGTYPANAFVYSGDTTGLTIDTSYLYHATGTTRKCEYACNAGFIWTGSSCCSVTSWSPDPSTVCSGQPFNQTSNCGTTRTAIGTKTCTNGRCGSAAADYLPSATRFIGMFCSEGTVNPASPVFPTPGNSVNWQCLGDGGTNETCTARHLNCTLQNGACSPLADEVCTSEKLTTTSSLCTSGSYAAGSLNYFSGKWEWRCNGSCGGSGVTCDVHQCAIYKEVAP